MTTDRGTLRSGGLGAASPSTGGTRVVLATSDPVFAALCQQALEGSDQQLLAAVPPAELVDTARRLAPELVVLDADGQEVAALEVLATKVMLVSDARLVVVSAYLAPGAPGLCALLASVAASFVQKARGASWFGLPQDDRAAFVAALRADLAADHGELRARADLDAGWSPGDDQPATTRSRA